MPFSRKGWDGYNYRGESLHNVMQPELASDREAWKRQPDEPTLWYNRFYQLYLLEGPKRSLLGAYKVHRRNNGYDSSSTTAAPTGWRYYYLKFRWVERAELYDQYMIDVLQEHIEDERYQMFLRHRDQARQWADAAMDWLGKVEGHRIASGGLALRAWLAGIDVETRSQIPPQILRLFEMTDAELQQFYEGLLATASGGGAAPQDEGDQDQPAQSDSDDPPEDD